MNLDFSQFDYSVFSRTDVDKKKLGELIATVLVIENSGEAPDCET